MMGPTKRKIAFRRVCIAVFCGVPAVGVIWLALTRWDGVPASMSHPVERKPRNPAFANALAALPPLPPITLPPPPSGMKWTGGSATVIDPSETMYGPWKPESRPNLKSTIAFLETPAVSSALDAMIALPPGEYEGQTIQSSSIRTAAKLLTTRARYRAEEKEDLGGAFNDLIGLLRMSQNVMRMESGILVLTGNSCESIALHELARLALERPLTLELTQTHIKRIEGTLQEPRSPFELITRSTTLEVIACLDASYTNAKNGNGWLVLSRQTEVLSGEQFLSEPRCGAWNILSPLFNDRRTVMSKVESIQREMLKADEMPFSRGRDHLRNLELNNPLNYLDGPAWINTPLSSGTYMMTLSRGQLGLRAAVTTILAISAYRTETKRLPESLNQLVPDFLSAVPVDPFDGQPLRFNTHSKDIGLLLYSVGPNQVDDGGTVVSIVVSGIKQGDQIYDFRRTQTNFEHKLEEVRN